jgi:hypothetical protein
MFNVIVKAIKETAKSLFNFKRVETTLKADKLTLVVNLDTQSAEVTNKKGNKVTMTRYYSTIGYKGDYYELKNEKGEIIPVLLKLEIIPTVKQ